MSIIINKDTKLIVQGITGREGQFHTKTMIEYGTNVVGGVTPGKGGQEIFGLPVFNTVKEAVEATGANATIIFVPAKFTPASVMEALDGLPPVKIHCSLLAEEAIHAALWDYAEKHHIKIEGLSKPKSDIHEGEEDTEEEY